MLFRGVADCRGNFAEKMEILLKGMADFQNNHTDKFRYIIEGIGRETALFSLRRKHIWI